MLVSEIVNRKGKNVLTVKDSSIVFDTVKKLDDTKTSAMLVVNENEELVGIISERDILYKCYDSGVDLKDNKVKNLMTSAEKLIVGKMEDTATYLMHAMIDKGIRHIPILENEEIVSIVAIEDVLKAVLETSESEAKLLREYIKNPFGVHTYK
ncbi:MAG: CBS domain-containing protein [Bacteroidales bacterium]|nr:CBS domain-containing protein [Bacteroidales bacterium]